MTSYFVSRNFEYTPYQRGAVTRSRKIAEAYFFDTMDEAEWFLKDEATRAGMAKIFPISEKEIFKMKLAGG